MIPYAVLVALALTGASFLLSGLGVVIVGRARLAGLLGSLSGATLLILVALALTGHRTSTTLLLLLAAQLGVLGLTAYPRLSWTHPVDFVALVLVAAAPVILLATNTRVPTSGAFAGGQAVTVLVVLVLILHTWWRLERATARDRGSLTWMALSAGSALLVGGVVASIVTTTFATVIACLVFALIGPALFVGVTRPEVVDVRGLVVRFIVMVTSLLTYLTLFTCVRALLDLVGYPRPSAGVLALVGAVCALTFHPTQVILRGVVDELLFGQRPDPLGAASQVADHLSDDPVLALRTIQEALVLPHASLYVGGVELASSGVPVTYTRTIPLPLGEGREGELRVGLRAGDLGLTAGDERVLKLVAPLLAQSVRARALAAEVQASREAAITAVAEERRRLRRDLHDGLGPRLSGIAFTSDAVRNILRRDPDSAEELLVGLRTETVNAIREIRQLVYGMRPQALDELGLVPAIRQQAAMLRTVDQRPLRVRIHATDLPALSAAVEVAAYRIMVEALTNAARHSGSDVAEASIYAQDGGLVVEVRDPAPDDSRWVAGVGLASMRERTAELGGTFSAGHTSGGGLVRAVLPLPQPAA